MKGKLGAKRDIVILNAAVADVREIAKGMKWDETLVICLSGTGDKDVEQIARYKGS